MNRIAVFVIAMQAQHLMLMSKDNKTTLLALPGGDGSGNDGFHVMSELDIQRMIEDSRRANVDRLREFKEEGAPVDQTDDFESGWPSYAGLGEKLKALNIDPSLYDTVIARVKSRDQPFTPGGYMYPEPEPLVFSLRKEMDYVGDTAPLFPDETVWEKKRRHPAGPPRKSNKLMRR